MELTRMSCLLGTGLLLAAAYASGAAETQTPATAAPLVPPLKGTVLHVAPSGADTNSGATADAPLQTFQAAAARMKPGDACLIHTGVYRETLTPPVDGTPDAPIVFQAAPGQIVTLSGLDPVTGWERVDARTFRAAVDWDLGAGNQVFRDGKPLTEARWPNRAGDDPFNPEGAAAEYEGSEFDRLRCTAFPDGWTADALAGATVWCMALYRWSSWTAPVTGYDPATRTLLVKGHDNWWVKENHNPGRKQKYGAARPAEFHISNARILLDAPGEWFYDSSAKQLYLCVAEDDDPNRAVIEMKRRQAAVDLTGRAHIQVRGLQVVGATLLLKDARHCLVTGITARYICHTRGGYATSRIAGDEGIIISGSGNMLRDSEIAFSTGAGVALHGTGNALVNCFIHDTDTMGSYACCVNMRGNGHLLSHNTLRDTGRDCLQYGGGTGHLIQYNDISGAGRICHDTGALYGNGDGGGTQICYNWVHGVNTGLGNGIYLDNYSANYLVHHNVVWAISGNACQVNHPGNHNMIFHNTLFGDIVGTYSPWKHPKTMFGTRLANNLVSRASRMIVGTGYTEVATVLHGLAPPVSGFDPARDVAQAGVDKGVLLPGVNDSFTGTAPDCGAYAAGQPLWRAGHDFARPPNPVHARTTSFHRNYLVNGSFNVHAKGVPGAWNVVAGKAEVRHFPGFNHPPADERFSVLGNSLALSGDGDARVEQSVEGLTTGTDFVFAAYVRGEGAEDIVLSVRTPQGEIGSGRYSATDSAVWRHVEATFRLTEAAPVTVVITKEGSGDAYVDDAGLVPVWTQKEPQ